MTEGQHKVVLVNPEPEKMDEVMRKVETLDKPRQGEDPKTWFVPSASREMSHKVSLAAISKQKAPKHGQEKCKHIIKVELSTSPAEYPNSIEGGDQARQPDKVLIGKCTCESFLYGNTLVKQDGQWVEEPTPKITPEVAKKTDPVFEDLPDFGVQVLWGKTYINKEGLLYGLRQKYPNCTIDTEVVEWNEERARVKAVIRNEEMEVSGHGTAYASNPVTKDRHLEMAETRAINRAIRHLFGLPLTLEEVID